MTGDDSTDHEGLADPDAADRADLDDTRLHDSIAALSRLTAGQLDLEELLTVVANYAVRAIAWADGAGLTLIEDSYSNTIVATAPFVTEVDDIQYGLGSGPCISAAAEGRTMISGSLGGDQRWQQFGSRVARLGVHSVVSLPLITPTGVVGAMNVYAHAKNVFDHRAAELGELFAAPAAVAVQNAQIMAQTQRLVGQLQLALSERGVIDRATGIIMSRTGASADDALERLRQMSQSEHVKLPRIAESFVDEALRRARARRTE